MTAPYERRSGAELARAVNVGQARAVELVAAAERVREAWDAGAAPLHAFVSVDFDRAADRALNGEADNSRQGAHRPLAGVPVAVGDNLSTIDFPTTCGSRLLEAYVPPFDATAVRRVVDAGATVVGKANLDEFAMGCSTEASAFGPTRNPHDRQRVAGGSAGGAAAAVAAGIVPFALGTDTGGGVRQPAAFCGVVGIRPTCGMVSRYGMAALAPSLDTVGVFGRTVGDAALLLERVAGHDPRDGTSAERAAPDLVAALGHDVRGMTIGVPAEHFAAGLDPRVERLCRAAVDRLKALGAVIRDVPLPQTAHAVAAYHLLSSAEAASSLARYDGARFGTRARGAASREAVYEGTRALFGAEARLRIVLGTLLLSADPDGRLDRARRVRGLLVRELDAVFAGGVDALFTPTTPTPAFRLGGSADPAHMHASHAFTVAASLAGTPALSLPIGFAEGLPVGGQLMGPAWSEPRLVRMADALERALALETAPPRPLLVEVPA
ncbi:MAG: gatA [Gemmatimonadetes bacterium]|nr:gatA [Gemmatimonadota bacterium]